ncbi:MAG: hypothetical protein GX318_08020 [Clostridia bacterium]|nr:hypothetical protein [Clostridia bacterium]
MDKAVRFLFLVLIALIFLGFNLQSRAEEREKAQIVDAFQELDSRDYELQALVGEEDDLEVLAKDIYCEPQLGETLEYLKEMREKGLSFRLDSVEYEGIEIIDHDMASAALDITSHSKGSFCSIEDPKEDIKELDLRINYQVKIIKEGDTWKISSIDFDP